MSKAPGNDGNDISMDAFNEHNNSSPMYLVFSKQAARVLQRGLDAVTSSVQRSEEKGLSESTSDATISGVQAINAYEFEHHAGCDFCSPHKQIYGVVEELRNTPQNVLFEVIQTITGSKINQKSFQLLKESSLAATRELQRICGKEEAKKFQGALTWSRNNMFHAWLHYFK
ncbi:hypothetical protein L1987_86722 [Smallanthus sonchifolius]|uniref:Uncharacterized protein n=1 Tax=Smallanthus sonchifolius TaxID=185202 RepID=A0ACB8XZI6_9ASTR|nr:hypothetical protein L1987_86722 [Smallanthus sonchifolius]